MLCSKRSKKTKVIWKKRPNILRQDDSTEESEISNPLARKHAQPSCLEISFTFIIRWKQSRTVGLSRVSGPKREESRNRGSRCWRYTCPQAERTRAQVVRAARRSKRRIPRRLLIPNNEPEDSPGPGRVKLGGGAASRRNGRRKNERARGTGPKQLPHLLILVGWLTAIRSCTARRASPRRTVSFESVATALTRNLMPGRVRAEVCGFSSPVSPSLGVFDDVRWTKSDDSVIRHWLEAFNSFGSRIHRESLDRWVNKEREREGEMNLERMFVVETYVGNSWIGVSIVGREI